jgi:hypothetical protein
MGGRLSNNHVHNVQTMRSIIWLPPTLAGLHFIYVRRWPWWRHVWRVMLRPVSTRTAHHVVYWRSSSLLIGYRPLDRSGIARSWWHASPYPKVHLAPYALLKCLETRTVKFLGHDLKTNCKKEWGPGSDMSRPENSIVITYPTIKTVTTAQL